MLLHCIADDRRRDELTGGQPEAAVTLPTVVPSFVMIGVAFLTIAVAFLQIRPR